MTNIFLFGINGKMGRAVTECAQGFENVNIAGGFDTVPDSARNVFSEAAKVDVPFDVIIDFSRPEALWPIIELSLNTRRPVVLATTGYSEKSLQNIYELSKKIPVFMSSNMSVGIHVLCELAAKATKLLGGGADIEIIEKHHNQKIDAPSGTAKMLAGAIEKALPAVPSFIYGRHGADAKRTKGEIGIHAVRGGTVVGEHEVSFYLNDEIITISHSAASRKILAEGAIKAAEFLVGKPCGLYGMKDLLESN